MYFLSHKPVCNIIPDKIASKVHNLNSCYQFYNPLHARKVALILEKEFPGSIAEKIDRIFRDGKLEDVVDIRKISATSYEVQFKNYKIFCESNYLHEFAIRVYVEGKCIKKIRYPSPESIRYIVLIAIEAEVREIIEKAAQSQDYALHLGDRRYRLFVDGCYCDIEFKNKKVFIVEGDREIEMPARKRRYVDEYISRSRKVHEAYRVKCEWLNKLTDRTRK